jgi:drug/metabolite transporter (DMT)-like permease
MLLRAAYLTVFVLSLAGGQMFFKRVGLVIRGRPPLESLVTLARQPAFYAALILYGFATLLWIWILARVPLSQAYPWVAASIAIVPILGWYVFGEQVRPLFWVGIGLILAGIMITQYASTQSGRNGGRVMIAGNKVSH